MKEAAGAGRLDDEWVVAPFDRSDAAMRAAAAAMLVEEFRAVSAWPTLRSAAAEVAEALEAEKLAFAAVDRATGRLLGWIGAQPFYSRVWELHPLVVRISAQRQGVGRALVARVEDEVRARGAMTLWLGTDDEMNLTSLGGTDLYPDVLGKLVEIRNLKGHPIDFYRSLGFEITGVVPDANGFGKPDILMAKRVGPKREP